MDAGRLPEGWEARAVRFGNELAWRPADARRLIEELRDAGYAVLGLEIWTPAGTAPRIWGWSEYEVRYDGDWRRFVGENAARAQSDLEKPLPPDGLVNLTWVGEAEFGRRG
jgi:hypothetical protein